MNTLYKSLFVMALSTLFQANSFAGDYSRSGISINLGNYHNGFQLNYSTLKTRPLYQHNKRYNTQYSRPSKTQYKQHNRPQLGYSKNHKQYDNSRHYNTLRPKYSNKPHNYRQYNSRYTGPSIKQFKQHSRPQLGYYKNTTRHHYDANRHNQLNKQACRPVTKIVTNRYGYSEKIPSTLCYDRHGYSSVTPSKRYRH